MNRQEKLVTALAIIDEKGREDADGNLMLWKRDWTWLRYLLLEVVDDMKAESLHNLDMGDLVE